jgi:excinuclease ABC subunit A
VDAGNTVLVIEHNLDVIKTADWVIDLGPEGGTRGGLVIAEGTPETIARAPGSATGEYLARVLRGEPLVPLSDVTFADELGRGATAPMNGPRTTGPLSRPTKRAAAAAARAD